LELPFFVSSQIDVAGCPIKNFLRYKWLDYIVKGKSPQSSSQNTMSRLSTASSGSIEDGLPQEIQAATKSVRKSLRHVCQSRRIYRKPKIHHPSGLHTDHRFSFEMAHPRFTGYLSYHESIGCACSSRRDITWKNSLLVSDVLPAHSPHV
jgi:hypothetical protein